MLIHWAYDLPFDRIISPRVLDSKYDIVAKAPLGTPRAESRVMLQKLLRERMALVLILTLTFLPSISKVFTWILGFQVFLVWR